MNLLTFFATFLLFSTLSFSQDSKTNRKIKRVSRKAARFFNQSLNNPDEKLGKRKTKIVKKAHNLLFNSVVYDIEQEASEYDMDRDSYVDGIESLNNFLDQVKADLKDFDNKSDSEKYVTLIKTGIRLNIQRQVRFPKDGHFEKIVEVRNIALEMTKKMGFDLQKLQK